MDQPFCKVVHPFCSLLRRIETIKAKQALWLNGSRSNYCFPLLEILSHCNAETFKSNRSLPSYSALITSLETPFLSWSRPHACLLDWQRPQRLPVVHWRLVFSLQDCQTHSNGLEALKVFIGEKELEDLQFMFTVSFVFYRIICIQQRCGGKNWILHIPTIH